MGRWPIHILVSNRALSVTLHFSSPINGTKKPAARPLVRFWPPPLRVPWWPPRTPPTVLAGTIHASELFVHLKGHTLTIRRISLSSANKRERWNANDTRSSFLPVPPVTLLFPSYPFIHESSHDRLSSVRTCTCVAPERSHRASSTLLIVARLGSAVFIILITPIRWHVR